MKILWVVNKLTGKLHVKINGCKSTGGLWLEAMIEAVKKDPDINIVIVNIGGVKDIRVLEDDNVKYYTIPGKANEHYDYKSEQSHIYWRQIIEEEKPDIIELWGTEMPIGLAVLEEAHNIPAVVYVQGILESIGRYYQAGMSDYELHMATTLRDVFTHSTIKQVQKRYLKRSTYEKTIVNKAKNIIVENNWAEAYYRKVCPDVNVYRCPLSISKEFETSRWNWDTMKQHTLMCSAANYPIKGLHMLLKALHIVKKYYPDIKLYIPGTVLRNTTHLNDRLKEKGYEKFIHYLIENLDLKQNVFYTGRLTAVKMAEQMCMSNCFVMCSAIENHSTTLKEAMTTGVPCVASFVGGIPEYARDMENCLLYRFEDYEMLAFNIMSLFKNKDLCQKISENAVADMTYNRNTYDFYEISKNIYADIIKRGCKE